MFTLKGEIQFDRTHDLSGDVGKCKDIYSHCYRLVIKVSSQSLQERGRLRGMVDDFSEVEVKPMLKEVHDLFDHKLVIMEKLNELGMLFEILFVSYRAPAEEMLRHVFMKSKNEGCE